MSEAPQQYSKPLSPVLFRLQREAKKTIPTAHTFQPSVDVDISYQEMNAVFMPRTRLGRQACERLLKGAYLGRYYIVPIELATAAHNRLIQEGARVGAIGLFGWQGIHHA